MSSTRVLVVAAVVLVVVALGAFVVWQTRDDAGDIDDGTGAPTGETSSTTEPEGGGSTSTETTAGTSPETTTTTVDVDTARIDEELEEMLVATGPGAFGPVRPETTALDLTAAAEAEADPEAERALLETRGFVRGRTRTWSTDAGATAVVTLYRFDDAESADLYLTDGLITLSGFGAETVDVPEVEGAQGFRQTGESDAGPVTVEGITFTRGEHWVLVVVAGPPEAVDPTVATELAAAQADRMAPPDG